MDGLWNFTLADAISLIFNIIIKNKNLQKKNAELKQKIAILEKKQKSIYFDGTENDSDTEKDTDDGFDFEEIINSFH